MPCALELARGGVNAVKDELSRPDSGSAIFGVAGNVEQRPVDLLLEGDGIALACQPFPHADNRAGLTAHGIPNPCSALPATQRVEGLGNCDAKRLKPSKDAAHGSRPVT